ncbi:MAG: zf-HC2 domain-containing protein [Gemmatimonadaceae bacterium]|nr:zf-HC2 domain-containing protein [Gemmatimonadaceae bacterium]
MGEAHCQDTGGIDCAEASRRLWAFLDGELPSLSKEEVEAHLKYCTGCTHLTEKQQQFLGLLHLDHSPAGLEAQAAALRAKILERLAEARASGEM